MIRHRAIARSAAAKPRLAVLVTVLIASLCMPLPRRAPDNLRFNLGGVTASPAAGVPAVMRLGFLGGSFSVMPKARRLATSGLDAIIRHPLDLFELLGAMAILLRLRSLARIKMQALIATLQPSCAVGS